MKPSDLNNEIINVDKINKTNCDNVHRGGILSSPPAESSLVRGILFVVNALTYFFLYAVALSSFLVAYNPRTISDINKPGSFYSTHIYLCVTGYVLILTQAILSFCPHGGWAKHMKYENKRKLYAGLQIVGSALAVTGCILKISVWTPVTNPHHAVNGWIAMIFTFISLIAGIINWKYEAQLSHTRFRLVHIFFYLLSLFMAFICLCYAFSYRSLFHDDLTPGASIACTVIALTGIIVCAYSMRIK